MRNRIDFVPSGNVAGQIAEVRHLKSEERNDHTRLQDGPDGKPVEVTVPGIDRRIRLHGHPFVYGVRAEQTDDGPHVLELHIDSPEHDVPVQPDDLRKAAKYLDRLAYAATEFVAPDTDAFHAPEKPLPKRPGRRGHGQEHYARVAEFAKAAHRQRRTAGSVRQAIAEHWTVSIHTADKWLARAREAGHLQAGDLGGRPPKPAGRRKKGGG